MTVQQKRRTQTAEYWLDEFTVHKDDLAYLYEWLVEEGEPRSIDTLVLRIMERRCVREEEALLKKSDRGVIYQPQEKYEVGQRVVFAAFDYATGSVVGVRAGDNPRHGPFSVIQVQMEGSDSGVREFATEFGPDHILKRSVAQLEDAGDLLPSAQLHDLYGPSVRARLEEALTHNEDFVQLGGVWFLRGLVPEVTPFHLNIAEAMIDERRQPLTAAQLLEEVELPSSSNAAVRAYALRYALSRDPRFAETSLSGESAWYLTDLIPAGVRRKPAHLVPMHRARGGELLHRELHDFLADILDETDELEQSSATLSGTLDRVPIVVNYPHYREGTFPLTSQALSLLSERPADRFVVTFVDQRAKETMPGWMIPGERYAWGLSEWYRRRGLPVGGLFELRRGDGPFTFLVSYEEGKRRSEWIKEAQASNGQLTFSMQRKAYAGRYDKHLLLEVGSVDDLDGLWASAGGDNPSLFEYLTKIFPELAKLSGQGLVHAKALYAAVNLTRRSGAIPIFAELSRRACFDPLGDGNWVYDESLRGVTYTTPEDMSRRPSSHRQDLIVDRVYPYVVNSEVKSP